MYKHITTLTEFILQEEQKIKNATGSFTILLNHIEIASKIIASHVKRSGLVDVLGSTGRKNIYNEDVQKLDELSNSVLVEMLLNSNQVYALGSEELEKPIYSKNKKGKYIVFFDPLDGSSNIDVNINIGTIFSIYEAKKNILQKGKDQIAAGYIIYGSSVMFVYSCNNGVHGFTLDPSIGSFLYSHPNIKIPKYGNIYSINGAYYDLFDNSTQKFLNNIRKKKNSKARYVGSMVADVHRTLMKGGIFMYPKDKNNKQGKLRLMHEINPISFLIQNAGGLAVSNGKNPLDIQPLSLHQRAPIILGSEDNVREYLKYT